MRVSRYLVAALLACSLPAPGWAQEDSLERQSRTELEARSNDLDHRVIELSQKIREARYNNDQAALEEAEKELKSVQKERVDTLRALGKLP